MVDDYQFDLEHRPPTPTLDLVTDYLEVKYADVLMRRDAVTGAERALAANRLAAAGSEALEARPSAAGRGFGPSSGVVAAMSSDERGAVVARLNALFDTGDWSGYRQSVERLYADGIISHDEMVDCHAAARAAEREIGGLGSDPAPTDRRALWQLVSSSNVGAGESVGGAGALTVGAPPTDPAIQQAAEAAWSAAGEKLAASWRAMGSGEGASGGGDAGSPDPSQSCGHPSEEPQEGGSTSSSDEDAARQAASRHHAEW